MCIVAFAWLCHPLYPLLLLQNRDEYHNRPTMALDWWDGFGEILGGRDGLGGGTWLGCSKAGRVAFLTNVLELHSLPDAESRGRLPVLFLQSHKDPVEFAEQLAGEAHQYNGFNLVLADISSRTMLYVSNRPEGEPVTIQEVSPGIHVLSNAKLDSPWPKAQRLRRNFKELLRRYGDREVPIQEMARKLMRDTAKADRSRLPGIASPDWELDLSSIFVEADTPLGRFGTRSIAALTVRGSGEVSFDETYLEGDTWREKSVSYRIQKTN